MSLPTQGVFNKAMYTLERAKYKLDSRNGRWQDADLSNEPVTTLLTRYGDVYLYVAYPGPGDGYVKGLYLRKVHYLFTHIDPNVTVSEWLTSLGNMTLPFESQLLEFDLRLVKYAQAWHVGYRATPVGRHTHIEYTLNDAHKEDLILKHESLDLSQFTKKALVTVNGFFHNCDNEADGVRVLDGNTNLRNVNDNQIGIYSFEAIGDIRCLPIKPEMVSSTDAEGDLYNWSYLTIPEDVDLENKSVLLVTGGYLNVLNESYYRINDRTWRVNFAKMLFLDRIFQSYEAMNLKKLNLLRDLDNPSLLSLRDLMDPEIIEAYLSMSTSFFVIVDSPSFFQEFEPLEYLKLPGRSVDTKYEKLPLVGTYGHMLDYHTIKEPGLEGSYPPVERLHVYCASLNIRNYYDNNKRDWPNGILANAGRYPANPFKHEKYYYRIMGVEY